MNCQYLTNYTLLKTIEELDYDKVLTPEMKLLMAKSLIKFNLTAIHKFITGQKEHGGDIRTRDLDEEIAKEHIDLFWYNAAKGWPKPHVIGAKKLGLKRKK